LIQGHRMKTKAAKKLKEIIIVHLKPDSPRLAAVCIIDISGWFHLHWRNFDRGGVFVRMKPATKVEIWQSLEKSCCNLRVKKKTVPTKLLLSPKKPQRKSCIFFSETKSKSKIHDTNTRMFFYVKVYKKYLAADRSVAPCISNVEKKNPGILNDLTYWHLSGFDGAFKITSGYTYLVRHLFLLLVSFVL